MASELPMAAKISENVNNELVQDPEELQGVC